MDNGIIFDSGLDFLVTKSWFEYLNIQGYPVLGILWNLSLLLVPYFSVVKLQSIYSKDKLKSKLSRFYAFFIFCVWFAFIPNAAYIITDVRHIANRCAVDSFYKVCPETAWVIPIFFLYSIFGLISFYYLMDQMRRFLDNIMGRKNAYIAILSALPVISFGVMLGLLNRLNSWELVTKPSIVLKASLLYFHNSVLFIDWISFTCLLIILYIIGGKIFKHS